MFVDANILKLLIRKAFSVEPSDFLLLLEKRFLIFKECQPEIVIITCFYKISGPCSSNIILILTKF